jgi:hypothetical protein
MVFWSMKNFQVWKSGVPDPESKPIWMAIAITNSLKQMEFNPPAQKLSWK